MKSPRDNMDGTELPLCPFCWKKASFGKGKKTSCQMHGEPMQAVTLQCRNPDCHVKPSMCGGDIFNEGETEARRELAEKWNTRTPDIEKLYAVVDRLSQFINSMPMGHVGFIEEAKIMRFLSDNSDTIAQARAFREGR